MSGARIRTVLFHHCLLPVSSILPELGEFEQLCTLCQRIAVCDPGSPDGRVSVSKAAEVLATEEAQLSAMLELASFFASEASQDSSVAVHVGCPAFFDGSHAHVFAIAIVLLVQYFGRHLFEANSQDHWPTFQGAHEIAVEQIELSKSTPGRTRPSKSGGASKAQRVHLRHVLRQFRGLEKRVAALLLQHAAPFLDLLDSIRAGSAALRGADLVSPLCLLLERADGSPLQPADVWPNNVAGGPVRGAAAAMAALKEHLEQARAASYLAYAAHEEVLLGDGGSDATVDSPRPPHLPAASGRGWHAEDVLGECRNTVLRGESDVSRRVLNIVGCHEATAYVLAPLHHVLISCCVGCTIVVGAAGGSLRVEACERVNIVAAARRVTVASCKDADLHLASNTPPLLVGDNRFVQLAPFNTAYEHLARHLAEAGVATEPFFWHETLELGRGAVQGGSPAHSESVATSPVQLMSPEAFLPFMVPFNGGPGPLCGGACTETFRWSIESEPKGQKSYPTAMPDIFPLPREYQEALKHKIRRVARMRSAVKTSFLDAACKQEVQAVIQAYFKEWLKTTNNIRQVFDLARLEREHARAAGGRKGKHDHDGGGEGGRAGGSSRRSGSRERVTPP